MLPRRPAEQIKLRDRITRDNEYTLISYAMNTGKKMGTQDAKAMNTINENRLESLSDHFFICNVFFPTEHDMQRSNKAQEAYKKDYRINFALQRNIDKNGETKKKPSNAARFFNQQKYTTEDEETVALLLGLSTNVSHNK